MRIRTGIFAMSFFDKNLAMHNLCHLIATFISEFYASPVITFVFFLEGFSSSFQKPPCLSGSDTLKA